VLRIGDVTQVLCNNRHHSCRNWRQFLKLKKCLFSLLWYFFTDIFKIQYI